MGSAVYLPPTSAPTGGKTIAIVDQPPSAAPAPNAGHFDGAFQSQPMDRPHPGTPAVDLPEPMAQPIPQPMSEPMPELMRELMPRPMLPPMLQPMPQPVKEFPKGSGNMVVDFEAHQRMYPGGAVLDVEMLLEVSILAFYVFDPALLFSFFFCSAMVQA